MKDNKLKSIEKDYIKANKDSQTLGQIAEYLKCDKSLVEDYIDSLKGGKSKKNKSSQSLGEVYNTKKQKEESKTSTNNISDGEKLHIWQRIKVVPYNLQKLDYYIAIGMFLATFILYIRTLTPSLSSGDNGELTTASYFLGVAHAPGYPLYVFLTKIFTYIPFGNVAYRANLFSAFSAAAAIFFVYMIFVKILGHNRVVVKGFNPSIHLPAMFTSFMFACADNMWAQAVIAETYALNILQVAILLFILLLWFEAVWNNAGDEYSYFGTKYLMAFGFVYGLAFGNQHIILPFGIAPLIFVLVVLVLVNKHRRVKYFEVSFLSVLIFTSFIVIGGFSYLRFIMSFQSTLFFHYSIPRDTSFFEIIFAPLKNPDLFMDIIKALGDKTFLSDHQKMAMLYDPIYPNLYKGMFMIFWPSFFMVVWFLVYKYILQKTDKFGKDHDYISSITIVYYQMLFAFLLGALVYMYMPIRARAMPPLNWGQLNEPSGWENLSYFFNMLHRKQYGNAGADVAPEFLLHFEQVVALFRIYRTQFTLVALLLLIPGLIQIFRKNKPIATFSIICFFMYTVPLTIYVNPPANDRSMAIFDVFFLPGTLYYAIVLLFGVQFYIEYVNKNFKNFMPNRNFDCPNEDKWYKRIATSQYVSIALVLAIMMVTFTTNFRRNNESNNWSNHDYSYNMMNTLPPNAILATEGGDNQVFGLAYYTMVERMRPDIKVYDQKGNVFERIYGNLMKVNYTWIDDISDEVDKTFIESGRPYYTTWKRDRLGKIGDYYFKKYGLLYRVQPIRYALVDELSLLQTMTIGECQALASSLLQRGYSYANLSRDINMLVEGKLVSVELEKPLYEANDSISFVAMYKQPYENLKTSEDYWNMYTIRGENSERVNWDYLTREIFVNYASSKIEEYNDQINNYYVLLSRDVNESQVSEITRNIDILEERRALQFDTMEYLGRDMPYVYYRLASEQSDRGNYDAAIERYRDMLKSDPHAYQAYINIAFSYEFIARSDDTSVSDELRYLNMAIEELEKAREIFFRGKGTTESSLQNNSSYQQILSLIDRMEAQKAMPRSRVELIGQQAAIDGNVEGYIYYSQVLMQRHEMEKSEYALLKALEIGSTDEAVMKIIDMQLGNIYANSQRFGMARDIYVKYLNEYTIEGIISITMLAQMAESIGDLNEAYRLYSTAVSKFSELSSNADIAQYYNFALSRASGIGNYLKQIGEF